MKYMVFDVGGTAIKYSVMDEELRTCEKGKSLPQKTPGSIFIRSWKRSTGLIRKRQKGSPWLFPAL
jgi:hypothetical protein